MKLKYSGFFCAGYAILIKLNIPKGVIFQSILDIFGAKITRMNSISENSNLHRLYKGKREVRFHVPQ